MPGLGVKRDAAVGKHVKEDCVGQVTQVLNDIQEDVDVCYEGLKKIIESKKPFTVADIKNQILIDAGFDNKINDWVIKSNVGRKLSEVEKNLSSHLGHVLNKFSKVNKKHNKFLTSETRGKFKIIDPNEKDNLLSEINTELKSIKVKIIKARTEAAIKNKVAATEKSANPGPLNEDHEPKPTEIAKALITNLSLDKKTMLDKLFQCCKDQESTEDTLTFTLQKNLLNLYIVEANKKLEKDGVEFTIKPSSDGTTRLARNNVIKFIEELQKYRCITFPQERTNSNNEALYTVHLALLEPIKKVIGTWRNFTTRYKNQNNKRKNPDDLDLLDEAGNSHAMDMLFVNAMKDANLSFLTDDGLMSNNTETRPISDLQPFYTANVQPPVPFLFTTTPSPKNTENNLGPVINQNPSNDPESSLDEQDNSDGDTYAAFIKSLLGGP